MVPGGEGAGPRQGEQGAIDQPHGVKGAGVGDAQEQGKLFPVPGPRYGEEGFPGGIGAGLPEVLELGMDEVYSLLVLIYCKIHMY